MSAGGQHVGSSQWRIFAFVFGGAVAVDAVVAAFHDRRPIGAFFEHVVAALVYWGSLIGGIAVGVIAGGAVFAKSGSKVLGWTGGIVCWLIVSLGALYLASKIPGVGWRVDRMLNAGDYR